jgi:hypothetical protein
MIVKRRRLQVFMLAPGRTGLLVRFCAVSFVGRGRDTQKVVVVVVVVIFFFFVNKEEGNLPARRTLTHIHPGQVFLFLLYFINFFLILKRVLRVLSV